ncbi:MAG: sulfatase [Bacteroidales bacterium]|nr:sulfatase [Bacteroidales bacterium]
MINKNLVSISVFAVAYFSLQSCENNTNEQEKPNILFCIADDASFPHMSAYGTSWVNTPGFDQVAEQGLLFTKAYTPNAKSAPSRACILTGRNSWQLEEAGNHSPIFPLKFKSFAEALSENGYHVGYTAKGWAPGIALNKDGKKRDLLVKNYDEHTTTPPAKFIHKGDYAANLAAFLDDNNNEKPFFFWYGSREPHRAYEFNVSVAKGGKKISDIDSAFAMWPNVDSVKIDMLDYAFEIEYFDKHLQLMLTELEERGLLENTIVVVTADNGMPFPRIKGQEYEMSNHLPLAISWPNGIKNPGRVINDYVNFIDFAPTFLELAGISEDQSAMQSIEGKSLTDIFYSKKEGIVNEERNHVIIGKERHDVGRPMNHGYPIRGIVKADFLYIMNFEPERWPAGNPETGYLNCDGSPTKTLILNTYGTENHYFWQWNMGKRPKEELYNVKNDPLCMNNLANNGEYTSLKEEMYNQMVEKLKAQKDPRMFGNGAIFENYPYSAPDYNTYYEKYMAGELGQGGWVNASDYRAEQGVDLE